MSKKCPWCKEAGLDYDLKELSSQWKCTNEQCWYIEFKKIPVITVEDANMPYYTYLKR